MPLVATKLIPGHALSRYKPYQTITKNTKPPQKKHTKTNHTIQCKTKPNQKKKNTKTNWVVLVKVLFVIFCSKSVNKNLIP